MRPHPYVLAAQFARVLHQHRPSEINEGAGNAGCTLHPRSRVRLAQRKMHTSIQVQRRQSGIPCAVVLRLISRSPRGPGFLAPVACVMRKHHRKLDLSVGRPGPRDFTVREWQSSSRIAIASTASRLTFGDDWPNAPLERAGMRENVRVICPTWQVRFLRQNGTTGNLRMPRMRNLPVGQVRVVLARSKAVMAGTPRRTGSRVTRCR